MIDTVLLQLGDTPKSRYEALLWHAKELVSKDGCFSFRSWRTELSAAVAAIYRSDDREVIRKASVAIYDSFRHLSPAEVKAIRVVCIGEQGDLLYEARIATQKASMAANRKGRSGNGNARNGAASIEDALRQGKIDREYQDALASLPASRRTVASLADAVSKPQLYVESYLRQHPDVAAQLADGQNLFLGFRTG